MDNDTLIVQDAFLQWISDKVTAAQLTVLYPAYAAINTFCRRKNILKKTIYEITDSQMIIQLEAEISSASAALISQEQQDAIQAALQLYRTFLGSELLSDILSKNTPKEQTGDLWEQMLRETFPDGYILDDFISRLQAVQNCGERCQLQGDELDRAIALCGTIKDGRVFPRNVEEDQLVREISNTICQLLGTYSCVHIAMIYQRYCQQLTAHAVYTEDVLMDLLLQHSNEAFIKNGSWLVSPGKPASVIEDCKKVMRDVGGAMSVEDVSKRLWFIPYDVIYHALSTEDDCINVGVRVWMLVEYFPLTGADVEQIANMLSEELNLRGYILYRQLVPLLHSRLPNVAENLAALDEGAVFNVIRYYLKNRFSFTKAIIAPLGQQIEVNTLYRNFAAEHDQFSLQDLEAFAAEISAGQIYWEDVFVKAVRIRETEFVNKNMVHFDVAATDCALEGFCGNDYLSFKEIHPSMMMHLPSCGYSWNGYLLHSYVYGYSKMFRIIYKSIGKTGYYGAMVRRSAGIISYEELVEHILTDSAGWNSRDDALDLLVSKGYQAVKKLKGIERIMERAKLNKLNK